jgi:ribosomal protein S18 acetylase RimI-like enzyme
MPAVDLQNGFSLSAMSSKFFNAGEKMKLTQLARKGEILPTYKVYKDCMFHPTPEKFEKKVDSFLSDNTVKIFACTVKDEIKGVIIVTFYMMGELEILGITVDETERNKGIGSFMINEIIDKYHLKTVYAETDKDAVGFYRKNGFSVTEFCKDYNGEKVVRYRCEKKK